MYRSKKRAIAEINLICKLKERLRFNFFTLATDSTGMDKTLFHILNLVVHWATNVRYMVVLKFPYNCLLVPSNTH